MKMLELQAGLGMDVKKYSIVFVFDNEKVLNTFINSGGNLVVKPMPLPKPQATAEISLELHRSLTAYRSTT
jgi:hypothetical protein